MLWQAVHDFIGSRFEKNLLNLNMDKKQEEKKKRKRRSSRLWSYPRRWSGQINACTHICQWHIRDNGIAKSTYMRYIYTSTFPYWNTFFPNVHKAPASITQMMYSKYKAPKIYEKLHQKCNKFSNSPQNSWELVLHVNWCELKIAILSYFHEADKLQLCSCLLYTSPSPRD